MERASSVFGLALVISIQTARADRNAGPIVPSASKASSTASASSTGSTASTAKGVAPPEGRKMYAIRAEDGWYPYTGVRNGKVEGLLVDILRAAFEAAGARVELLGVPYARCMSDARSGAAVACFNTIPDASNLRYVTFPRAGLMETSLVIVGSSDGPRAGLTLDDLRGKKVGIVNGYDYGNDFARRTDLVRVQLNSEAQLVQMVARRRVDFALVYLETFRYLIRTDAKGVGGQVGVVGNVDTFTVYPGFSKAHPDAESARSDFEKGLDILRRDGSYERIVKEWESRFR